MRRSSGVDPRDLAERVELDVARFVAENAPDYVRLFLRVLSEKAPKSRGRPQGSGEDDRELLGRMADLLLDGEAQSEREAATRVVASLPATARTAAANRLRRKYAARREALNASAAKRAGAEPRELDPWERAFSEEVEGWDL